MTCLPFPDGPVDLEQAAEFAGSQVDEEAVARGRAMGEELDQLHERVVELVGRLVPLLDELLDREDAATYLPKETTWRTVIRARDLFNAWSGASTLRARSYRVINALCLALGFDERVVDDKWVDEPLVEEQGR